MFENDDERHKSEAYLGGDVDLATTGEVGVVVVVGGGRDEEHRERLSGCYQRHLCQRRRRFHDRGSWICSQTCGGLVEVGGGLVVVRERELAAIYTS